MNKDARLPRKGPSRRAEVSAAAMRIALTPGLRTSEFLVARGYNDAGDLDIGVRSTVGSGAVAGPRYSVMADDVVGCQPASLRTLLVSRAICIIDPNLSPPLGRTSAPLGEGGTTQLVSEGPTPFPSMIVSAVERGFDVLVYGRSASGKTIAARNAQRAMMRLGIAAFWLDLSVPDASLWDFVAALAQLPLSRRAVLFIDDAQAMPAEAEQIRRLRGIASRFPNSSFSWFSSFGKAFGMDLPKTGRLSSLFTSSRTRR